MEIGSSVQDLKNTSVCHPKFETWFICWDDLRENIMTYGSILPTQCMETHWNQIDYYFDELDWKAVLLENGIIIEEDND